MKVLKKMINTDTNLRDNFAGVEISDGGEYKCDSTSDAEGMNEVVTPSKASIEVYGKLSCHTTPLSHKTTLFCKPQFASIAFKNLTSVSLFFQPM